MAMTFEYRISGHVVTNARLKQLVKWPFGVCLNQKSESQLHSTQPHWR